jgi:DNA mismatch endonuclease (patch repair protein)
MTDTVSVEKRSEVMSSIRSADTKPEWILRFGLHRMGFRYRLRDRSLPGTPDLVFPKYRTVVFVHGCFWHRHEGCRRATFPKSRQAFWAEKFAGNVERDARTRTELENAGWRVLVVWECELQDATEATLERVAGTLRSQENRELTSEAPPRRELLDAASEKVRLRVASYKAGKFSSGE